MRDLLVYNLHLFNLRFYQERFSLHALHFEDVARKIIPTSRYYNPTRADPSSGS